MTTNTELDADELLHLAVSASDRDETDRAVAFLKRAIAVAPGDAKAHYLLGAEHAQLGMFDRAIEEMGTAVQLDPQLHGARFQLGMLLLTSQKPGRAEEVWAPLDSLGPDHFYVLFKDGLLHLARDQFAECLRCLRAGMAANQENMPLNGDMQRIATDVEAILATQGAGAEPAGATETETSHLLLNAYTASNRR